MFFLSLRLTNAHPTNDTNHSVQVVKVGTLMAATKLKLTAKKEKNYTIYTSEQYKGNLEPSTTKGEIFNTTLLKPKKSKGLVMPFLS